MAIHALAQIVVVKGDPTWTDITIACATVVTAIVAAVAAYIGLAGVKNSRDDAATAREQDEQSTMATRAIHYLERYNARSHIHARVRLHDFFLEARGPGEQEHRIKEWAEGMSYAEKVRAVEGINFWEELAGMYNRNLVDREIIDDYFGPEAESIWQSILWFVEYQRDAQDRDAMAEFQAMVVEVRKKRSEEGKQIVDGPIENPPLPPVPPSV